MNEKNQSNSFKVFVRVRPFNKSQQQQITDKQFIKLEKQSITVKNKGQDQSFSFNKIYNPQSSQIQLFTDIASDIIDNSFIGINGTIFCYGQTSSGKTHTIVGDYENFNSQRQGILPRVLSQVIKRKNDKILFNHAQNLGKIDIKLKISMVQIYNQKVKDLLGLNKEDLKIRQNKKQGVFIQNVTQQNINNIKDAMTFLKSGIQNRTVGKTNMNAVSSRSHMLFIITINEINFDTREVKTSKITLVDLAGSQKISKTGAQGKLLLQAKKINTSLSTLAKVIMSLSQGKSNHISYRDSKLTRLLQQSIGGNSLTRLIINISPCQTKQPQIMTSLRFGASASKIKNCPKVNKQYTLDQLSALLEKAELKIQKLMKVIEEYRKKDNENCGNIYQKAITLHMIDIGDYQQQEYFQQYNLSFYDKSNDYRSTKQLQDIQTDKFSCSMTFNFKENQFQQQKKFNNTGQFSFNGEKLLRKPTLTKSMTEKSQKSLKSIKLIEQKDQNDKFESIIKEKEKKKSVKIADDNQNFFKNIGSDIEALDNQILAQNLIQKNNNKVNKTLEDITQKINQLKNIERPVKRQGKSSSIQLRNIQFIQTIKQQIQKSCKQKIKSQMSLLKSQIKSMSQQMKRNATNFQTLNLKYQQTLLNLQKQRLNVKSKQIKIQKLKEKYAIKKQQINTQIIRLKDFWQNQVKI